MGTTLSVLLPLGKDHLRESEMIAAPLNMNGSAASIANLPLQDVDERVEEHSNHAESPVVLVVEDNKDMQAYIKRILSGGYGIIESDNGIEALGISIERVPDLIVSDVMMPEMDGYEFCRQVKSNVVTSHIPIILLTAKADRESKLAGLQTGADDYLAKPFDADELRLLVRNRIAALERMRAEYRGRDVIDEPNGERVSSLDDRFMANLRSLIHVHLDDEDFSIGSFASESGYSRMQFYRKIKALTGLSPSQFVRSIRLQRAAQLLFSNHDNVAQIAYSVGFSSPAYFNKCFKDQFGVTPGQYAEEHPSSPARK